MRILVTGGAGFIGSHLTVRLVREGHQVTVLDDCSAGDPANLAELSPGDYTFVRGSILDPQALAVAGRDAELIFHLAAVVGVLDVLRRPIDQIRVNVGGTERILDLALETGARVVLASTSEVYGKTTSFPNREDDDRVLGSTRVGRWAYSTAKALDEHLGFAYAAAGLRVSMVRYFNSYGPRTNQRGYGSVIGKFLEQALTGRPITIYGDGQQRRSFTYVSDTVEGTILAGTVPAAVGQVFNIGNPVECPIQELAERVIRCTDRSVSIEYIPYETAFGAGFEDTRRRLPDLTRSRAVLGFEPRVDLEQGLIWSRDWVASTLGSLKG
ncbi:MAG TPA: NAD-dependent epimerase/dehydratase family protein [Dehalococcoidia bacterium]|nr:NAD-dependent epimerase/dehydratase family protein [Dehalococcoidia bacterium]